MPENKYIIIERGDFGSLFEVLKKKGYTLTGPTVRSNAVVYDDLSSVDDLPIGWTDKQDGGYYRLVRDKHDLLFGYVVGPQSWKKFIYPPRRLLYEAKKAGHRYNPLPMEEIQVTRRALIGVRPCELQALAINDKVLTQGPYADPYYQKQRANLFIVAVNCVRPGGTCFCASMGTGPKAESGYDLVLTEVFDSGKHYFLAEAGSNSGRGLLNDITGRPADESEISQAEQAVAEAVNRMGRKVDTRDLKTVLENNFDHPHWEEITKRCLTCGNCTSVCPTCFCVNVEDTTSLGGETAQRWRRWDSCYNVDFSYIHGGSIRATETSRHRQWVMHKMSYWHDQFGTSGCVGCGRCITWCPVGIDITEEVRKILGGE
nr:4Fe-4S dicluster domain-containing protein [candidate division Zixibacteria bacterium]